MMPPLPPPPAAPIYSADLLAFDKEAAIWIYGGYPQRSHMNAEYALMAECVAEGFPWVGPAAIWKLERKYTYAPATTADLNPA